MSRPTRAVALVGALLGGGLSYLLYPDVLLAVAAGFCWGVGSAFGYRERETWTRGSDGVSLVNALPAVLISVVGTFGLNVGLDVPDSLRWALVSLVAGVVLAAAGTGIVLGRRAATAPEAATESGGRTSGGAD